jgi:scyllo-inositol 2-dehydrogenase (NADP+)
MSKYSNMQILPGIATILPLTAFATIKTGIAGAGLSATLFHLPFLLANNSFNVTSILRQSKTPLDEYPLMDIFTDEIKFLQSDIDLVIITTPSDSHYRFCKNALLSKKHVVVEKPFTVTFAEALELNEIAKASGLALAVYHNRIWDGDFITIKSLIENETLGRIVEFQSSFEQFQ